MGILKVGEDQLFFDDNTGLLSIDGKSEKSEKVSEAPTKLIQPNIDISGSKKNDNYGGVIDELTTQTELLRLLVDKRVPMPTQTSGGKSNKTNYTDKKESVRIVSKSSSDVALKEVSQKIQEKNKAKTLNKTDSKEFKKEISNSRGSDGRFTKKEDNKTQETNGLLGKISKTLKGFNPLSQNKQKNAPSGDDVSSLYSDGYVESYKEISGALSGIMGGIVNATTSAINTTKTVKNLLSFSKKSSDKKQDIDKKNTQIENKHRTEISENELDIERKENKRTKKQDRKEGRLLKRIADKPIGGNDNSIIESILKSILAAFLATRAKSLLGLDSDADSKDKKKKGKGKLPSSSTSIEKPKAKFNPLRAVKGGGLLSLIAPAIEYFDYQEKSSEIDRKVENKEITKKEAKSQKTLEASKGVGASVGGVSGAFAGGAVGATIGSVVPIVGTLVGGLVGSLIGGFGGSFLGREGGQEVGEYINNSRESKALITETVSTKEISNNKESLKQISGDITKESATQKQSQIIQPKEQSKTQELKESKTYISSSEKESATQKQAQIIQPKEAKLDTKPIVKSLENILKELKTQSGAAQKITKSQSNNTNNTNSQTTINAQKNYPTQESIQVIETPTSESLI